ncbi:MULTISPECIES: sensor histidine kinase [unclassified Brevundimonas]|jgi:two-component system osmolarity sensor histidine kinase EnvZ|uniref:sensor histidine kinase n=1 Tax=unclassified Brevundimonas TaxID=2622653 RepID=UPI000C55DAD8|nr:MULTISPECIES: ATP-binding protein [unclassified Brevundimonas]MAL88812.1 two-component sensor histidine kinase [Brevundimonas sp.]HAJ02369.1 two-component sensor histidine kinase [Brevundimonas sp.]|tara:strand:+ start:10816 stop:12159 length:1344 start_codon:yes stop_codon:yes gene_type:complete
MKLLPSTVWTRFLKRRLPTSLWGRSLLIIVLPVLVMQVFVTWTFFDAHWQTVNARLSEGLAGDIAWAVETYAEDPTPEGLETLAGRAERTLSLSVAWQEATTLPESVRRGPIGVVDRALEAALASRLDRPFWFDTTRYPNYIDIRVQVGDGVMRIIAPRERAVATQAHIFVVWLLAATVLLMSVAILFIRNQVRAIERLAAAAEAFGRGETRERFKPHGAREVRAAARAFMDMRDRIQRHIDQRTALLASVSHDLRTPLTRLRLELALAPPFKRASAMQGDLDQMEHMIDEYLAFAQGEAGEASDTLSVADLLDQAAEDARRIGATVEVDVPEALTVNVRPLAFRRALTNLVGNAAAHGDTVRLSARRLPSGATELAVEDDGPGIPEDMHEEAFRPFSRLDASRNQNRKGVGLGLAIARDVARGHGGDITLDRSTLGGLMARIRLPG